MRKYAAGDRILIKKTGEEGKVVRYLNRKVLEVEMNNECFPIAVDEVDFPYFKRFTEQRKERRQNAEQKAAEDSKSKQPAGFYLSFIPVFSFDGLDDVVTRLEVYFHNHTPESVKVQYACKTKEAVLHTETLSLSPFEKRHLHGMDFERMNEQPRFSCTIALAAAKKNYADLEETLRVKPKKLFEHFSKFPKQEMPPFLLKIADVFPLVSPVPKIPKGHISVSSLPVRQINPTPKAITKIDLHFEKLAPDAKGLSNFEILTLQLDALEDALDQAIRAHQQSMTIIHGVGKGKLKEAIHSLLRSYPEINFFRHSWMPGYGYGATEVFFK